ncbi:exodeoxyribonuclease III [Candidatus Kinetoplastidibacterium crithidiae]|uniref:exodeoxyribonuclease III n=1 Tax=Candidatus Kinetoplastidibacterium crithidiae TaxID=33056 RepID=UPI0002A116AF|nr:endonuclease [Candidatus Kinetoplastibacterium crithidii (ex Angomonas deanei ATCC 30255)]
MLRITSINVNGIRSAIKKKFLDWLYNKNPDIVCLQEIRIASHDIKNELLNPLGFKGFFYPAQKNGYSGVGIYTKKQPMKITRGLEDKNIDSEGRVIRIDWEKISIINVYFPSGSNDERQKAKLIFLQKFELYLKEIYSESILSKRNLLICGDWNIAHTQMDIKNWKNNLNKPGFLPEERNWLSEIINNYNLVDVFRKLHPHQEQYTWWSNRARSWERNVGWRIDYQMANNSLANLAISSEIYMETRFSDHAPLTIDYKTEI